MRQLCSYSYAMVMWPYLVGCLRCIRCLRGLGVGFFGVLTRRNLTMKECLEEPEVWASLLPFYRCYGCRSYCLNRELHQLLPRGPGTY